MAQPLTSNPAPRPVLGVSGTPVPATNGPMNPAAATDRIRNLSHVSMAQPFSPNPVPSPVLRLLWTPIPAPNGPMNPTAATDRVRELKNFCTDQIRQVNPAFFTQPPTPRVYPTLPYVVAKVAHTKSGSVPEMITTVPSGIIINSARESQLPGPKLYARC